MLLQKESSPGLNTVTAYGPGYVEINGQRYSQPVHFEPEGNVQDWVIEHPGQLTLAALQEIAGVTESAVDPMAFLDGVSTLTSSGVEVVLIGTGDRQVMLSPSLAAPLQRIGIGIEAMSTQAAARTYNILMSEGRRVVAALIPPQDTE